MEFIYEDGLRLSELYGQLAGAEYVVDHLLTTKFGVLFVMGLITALTCICLAFALYNLLDEKFTRYVNFEKETDTPKDTWLYVWKINERWWSYEAKSKPRLWVNCMPIVVCAIIVILVEVVTVIVLQDLAAKDVIQIQAQIDAILSKYQ